MTINISQTIAATLFDQSENIADMVLHSDQFLVELEKAGKVKRKAGGYEFRRPVMFNDTAIGGFFAGFEEFDLTVPDDATSLVFPVRQCYEPVGISGREKRANRDSEQLFDLIEMKIEAATARLRNKIVASLHGTGTDPKEFEGIQKAVSTTPTLGTYGGQSRAAYTWMQNQIHAVSGGMTAANIQENLTEAITEITRGTDGPGLGVFGRTQWRMLHSSMTAIQRITDDSAEAGFKGKSLLYDGVKCIYEGYKGDAVDNQVRLLNLNYWDFTMVKDADFKPLEPELDRPINQDAYFSVILVEGALCCNGLPLQNVLFNS